MSIEHVAIPEAELHEPKGISTALINQILVADGAGSGAWATPNTPTNTVYVSSLSNFPTPAGGIIILADDTHYVITADVSSVDRFQLGDNNSITADNINGPVLTYTGTGAMFTGVDKFFDIHDITLNAANGSVFDLSDTGGGQNSIFTMRTVGVLSCVKYGTINDILAFDISDSNCLAADDGLSVLGGPFLVFSITKFALISGEAGFTGIDFGTSTHQNIELSNLFFIGPGGAVGLDGLTGSGNMVVGSIATVDKSTFAGGMTALNNIDITDIRWQFSNNSGTDDSTKAADAYLSTATVVTISGSSTFTAIGDVNFLTDTEARFSVATNGVITYLSEQPACFVITCTATVEKVGGGTDVIAMRLALNGTSEAKSQSQTQSADPTSVVSQAILNLVENDTIETMVANNDSTANINVLDMNIGISLSG